jgi:hypothetical protein
MSDEYTDPSGNTAQFQAFANRVEEPAPAKGTPVGLLVGIGAAVIVVVAVLAYLVLS